MDKNQVSGQPNNPTNEQIPTNEQFTYEIRQKCLVIYIGTKKIAKNFENMSFTNKEITEIFSTACKLGCIKNVTSLLIDIQGRIGDHNIDQEVVVAYQNDIDEMFRLALLNGDTKVIKIFAKYGIKSSEQIVKKALTMPNNQENADKAIIAVINEYYDEKVIFDIICQEKGIEATAKFLAYFKKDTNCSMFINRMFDCALLTPDCSIIKIFKDHGIKTDQEIIIDTLKYATILDQQEANELMNDVITNISPVVSLNGNGITKIFNDVCKSLNITNVTNLMRLFSQYENIISPCNIAENVIFRHQYIAHKVLSNALLTQDHQVIDMCTKLGIKSQKKLVTNSCNKKTHQQSITTENQKQETEEQQQKTKLCNVF